MIQTDAVKNYLIPICNYRENLQWLPYAEEADLLNVALFGFTAKAWRDANPELAKHSNIRDYSSINELTVLSNLETHNAQMIREGKSKEQRFSILKEIAEYQINILNEAQNISNRIERIKQVTNPAEEVIIKRAGDLRQIDYGGKKNDKLEKS